MLRKCNEDNSNDKGNGQFVMSSVARDLAFSISSVIIPKSEVIKH